MKRPESRKVRTLAAILTGCAGILLIGLGLRQFQFRFALRDIRREMEETVRNVEENYDSNKALQQSADDTFRALHSQDLQLIAWLFENDPDAEVSDDYLALVNRRFGKKDLIIADRDGAVLASASGSAQDLTDEQVSSLRESFRTGEVTDMVFRAEEQEEGVSASDGQGTGASEQDTVCRALSFREDLAILLRPNEADRNHPGEYTDMWSSMLEDLTIGEDGLVFAWDAGTGEVLYDPFRGGEIREIGELGLDTEKVADGGYAWNRILGREMYVYTSLFRDSDTGADLWIAGAAPKSSLTESGNSVVFLVWLIEALIIADVVYYIYLLLKQKRVIVMTDFTGTGRLFGDTGRRYKLLIVSILAAVIVALLSFYLQTLFLMSSWAGTASRHTGRIVSRLSYNEGLSEIFVSGCDAEKGAQLSLLSWYLERYPDQQTVETLDRLSVVLDDYDLQILDKKGKSQVGNSGNAGDSLSPDFSDRLRSDLLDAAAGQDDGREVSLAMSGGRRIVQPMTDSEINVTGYVYAMYYSAYADNVLMGSSFEGTLDRTQSDGKGFAFTVSRQTGKFTFFPDSDLVGRDALEYGLKENQLRDNFCDYVTVDKTTYYASTEVYGDTLIYYAVAKDRLLRSRIFFVLLSTAAAVFFLALTGLPLYTSTEHVERVRLDETSQEAREENGSAEYKAFRVMLYYTAAAAATFAAYSLLYADVASSSVFNYVTDGNWERGFNVFALTAAAVTLSKGGIVLFVGRKLVNALAGIFPVRGGTILRMLASLVTYVGLALLAYQCMLCFGLNPTALMASAGIASIVIGIGANSLVGDILAGIFLLVEGNVQVGDVVKIGDFRGYVMELGIRMTKLFDMDTEDVKIIPNKEVQNVVHMTVRTSIVYSCFLIGYDEDLERVEKLLSEEMKSMATMPYIIGEPRYIGVSALGDNGVILKTEAKCHEAHRLRVEREVNRCVYMMFRRNGIEIPYPQLTLHSAEGQEDA